MTDNENHDKVELFEEDGLNAEDEKVVKNLLEEGFHVELILKAIEETGSHNERECMTFPMYTYF